MNGALSKKIRQEVNRAMKTKTETLNTRIDPLEELTRQAPRIRRLLVGIAVLLSLLGGERIAAIAESPERQSRLEERVQRIETTVGLIAERLGVAEGQGPALPSESPARAELEGPEPEPEPELSPPE